MKKIITIFIFIILFTNIVSAAENVGIIKGIWFSDSQFFDGDTIRIYTAVQNNSGDDASGSIEFFDNGESLGSKSFSTLNNRIIESWMDTTAVSGEHEFSVRITQLKKGNIAVTAQEIFSERLTIVKIDTDDDDIPDDIDTDDDGDGVSDVDEVAADSDPLDSTSIPEESEETTNNPITTIINNIFNTDSPNGKNSTASDNNSNTDTENTANTKNDLLEQSPDFAQKIAEQNDVIRSLVLQISRLQNDGKNIIEHEQKRLGIDDDNSEKLIGSGKTIRIKNKKEIIEKGDIKIEKEQERSFSGFLVFIYRAVLGIFLWLFSVWWFVVLLLFLGIYLALKLLFRVFGRSGN